LDNIKSLFKDKLIVLVGNKGFANRIISFDEGLKISKENSITYFEVSCINNINIKEIW